MGIKRRIKSLFPFFFKKGISVIVSCQDDHLTLRDCVETFMLLGDEVIIVTNRATPETYELANTLAGEYKDSVSHCDAPEAFDLYQNRQAGLERAQYRWVMRCDADYVAYEECDGEHSITHLRRQILEFGTLWPTAVFCSKPCLSMGWSSMYEPASDAEDFLKYIPAVYTGKTEARLYSQNPFLKFTRLGRWEGVPGVRWYRKVTIEKPYWFEVTLRSSVSLLYRKARTDWRQHGDFSTYPELADYVDNVFLPREYPGLTLEEAAERYIAKEVMPKIERYDEERFFPLPERIRSKDLD